MRISVLTLLILLLSGLTLNDASARVFIGGGVVVGSPYYYYPPYYYAYYPPSPYPYPYPYAPPVAAVPPPESEDRYYTASDGEYCREYRYSAVIDGEQRTVFGHACREPDGQWQVVD